MKEIDENDYNLNISRYVSTAEAEEEIDLASVALRVGRTSRSGYGRRRSGTMSS